MHGARVGGARNVVVHRADCQVGHAVAVQVAEGRDGHTKAVAIVQPGAVLRVVVDLCRVLYRAVGVHQYDVHGAPAGAAVADGADCQVRHAVAVQVAEGRDGHTKVVFVVQPGAVFRKVVDLHDGGDRRAVAGVRGVGAELQRYVVNPGRADPELQVARAVAGIVCKHHPVAVD